MEILSADVKRFCKEAANSNDNNYHEILEKLLLNYDFYWALVILAVICRITNSKKGNESKSFTKFLQDHLELCRDIIRILSKVKENETLDTKIQKTFKNWNEDTLKLMIDAEAAGL